VGGKLAAIRGGRNDSTIRSKIETVTLFKRVWRVINAGICQNHFAACIEHIVYAAACVSFGDVAMLQAFKPQGLLSVTDQTQLLSSCFQQVRAHITKAQKAADDATEVFHLAICLIGQFERGSCFVLCLPDGETLVAQVPDVWTADEFYKLCFVDKVSCASCARCFRL
jgi:hypothetical protein